MTTRSNPSPEPSTFLRTIGGGWEIEDTVEFGELKVDEDFSMWKPEFGWWLQRRERVVEKLDLR